jgi:hypothetical protein
MVVLKSKPGKKDHHCSLLFLIFLGAIKKGTWFLLRRRE